MKPILPQIFHQCFKLVLTKCRALLFYRGSNALVSSIQSKTKIPVLGHADGVCHMYIDAMADEGMAIKCMLDAKLDYPAACNATETVLVHEQLLSDSRMDNLMSALRSAGITTFGGPRAAKVWQYVSSSFTSVET